MSKRKDITGQKFGRLTAIKFLYNKNGSYWLFKCDCGNEKIIHQHSVTSGSTKSCGCIVKEVSKELMRNIKRCSMTEETKIKIGLANKGRKYSDEIKQQMSERFKGRIPWNKGKTGVYSEEQLKIMRINSTGRIHSEETKRKMSEAGKNKIFTEEHRKHLSEANKGRPLTEECKEKISKAKIGSKSWNKGKTGIYSDETIEKMSEAKIGLKRDEETKKKISESSKGENNCKWKGDSYINKQGYVIIETDEKEREVEHRYVMEKELGRKLDSDEIVHHVDENRLNNSISNLQIMSNIEHLQLHRELRRKKRKENNYGRYSSFEE